MKMNPFRDYKTLLLSSDEDQQTLQLLMRQLDTGERLLSSHLSSSALIVAIVGESVTLLGTAREDIYSLCSHAHQFAFDIVFAPLRLHLADVPTMPVGIS